MEHSATLDNDEAKNGADRAIDLNLGTNSWTVSGSEGTSWLKLTLDKVYCAQQVIRYRNDGTPHNTWTCTDKDCTKCEHQGSTSGSYCSVLTLTVSTEGAVSDLSPASDCKYGDTVKFERDFHGFLLTEIAIVRKSGNLYTTCYCTNCGTRTL